MRNGERKENILYLMDRIAFYQGEKYKIQGENGFHHLTNLRTGNSLFYGSTPKQLEERLRAYWKGICEGDVNTERVFLIITSNGHQKFCHVGQIQNRLEEMGTNEGYYKIYHFWDNKPKVASKKLINDMLKAQGKTEIF